MKNKENKHRCLETIDERDVINNEGLSAYYLISLAGKYTSSASRLLRKRYAIGVVEWRLISGLVREPDIAANQLSKYTLTDKAQVSKALKSLEKKGLIEAVPSSRKSQRKTVRLTERGYQLHDAHLPSVVERERFAFEGLDEAEIEQFFATLRRVSSNIDSYVEKVKDQ